MTLADIALTILGLIIAYLLLCLIFVPEYEEKERDDE